MAVTTVLPSAVLLVDGSVGRLAVRSAVSSGDATAVRLVRWAASSVEMLADVLVVSSVEQWAA
jgi:N-acetylglucosamine kinase-like BadF-type ATPase